MMFPTSIEIANKQEHFQREAERMRLSNALQRQRSNQEGYFGTVTRIYFLATRIGAVFATVLGR